MWLNYLIVNRSGDLERLRRSSSSSVTGLKRSSSSLILVISDNESFARESFPAFSLSSGNTGASSSDNAADFFEQFFIPVFFAEQGKLVRARIKLNVLCQFDNVPDVFEPIVPVRLFRSVALHSDQVLR
jgi:hypothetical protein